MPRRRRTGRLLAAGAAATVVLAAGGILAGHVLAASSASSRGSAPPSFVPASAGPTFTRSTSAAPATTASGATPGTGVPRVQGPSLIDPLDRPAQWKATAVADNASGWCAFKGGRMVVTTHLSSVYSCPGPADTFAGDQSIAVDATVVSPGACAVIWLRMVEDNGYRVSLCSAEIRIALDEGGRLSEEKKAPSTAFQVGQTHRAGVSVKGGAATVTVDGAATVGLPLGDPQLAAGKVELGAVNDADSGDATAAFADVELRSPAVGTPVKFPDLAGAAQVTSPVKLYSYDPSARAVVAEPVLFLTGADYCKLFKIKQSDGRCQSEWETVESHLKLTLPVAATAKLYSSDNSPGDGACVGGFGVGGTCPTTTAAFTGWLKENKGGLVAVSAAGGRVTKLAQMYTP